MRRKLIPICMGEIELEVKIEVEIEGISEFVIHHSSFIIPQSPNRYSPVRHSVFIIQYSRLFNHHIFKSPNLQIFKLKKIQIKKSPQISHQNFASGSMF